MLLSEKYAREICEKLLSYVKADDAIVSVNSEDYSHLRFASNAFTRPRMPRSPPANPVITSPS